MGSTNCGRRARGQIRLPDRRGDGGESPGTPAGLVNASSDTSILGVLRPSVSRRTKFGAQELCLAQSQSDTQLLKLERLAQQRGTSIDALVREVLADLVAQSDYDITQDP